jgi:two-component system response regulator RegA
MTTRGALPQGITLSHAEKSAPAAEKHAPAVLVIEDELLLRWAICERLREDGYEISEATTGAEARAATAAAAPTDLTIVLDFRLPDVSDLSLVRALRAARPDARIIMMSAHSTAQDRTEAMNEGVVAFLQKPFDVSTLVRTVRDAREERL